MGQFIDFIFFVSFPPEDICYSARCLAAIVMGHVYFTDQDSNLLTVPKQGNYDREKLETDRVYLY